MVMLDYVNVGSADRWSSELCNEINHNEWFVCWILRPLTIHPTIIVDLSRLRSSLAFFAMLRFLAFDHHSSRTIKELVSGLVSTTVLLCTIILASSFFSSALILWAKLKNRSSQKRAVFAENLVAPPHHGFFWANKFQIRSKPSKRHFAIFS